MNALFLKDLRVKVKRGLEGRVRQGRSGGGLGYGYDVVREYDSRGELIRGGRKSNEAEAAIVCRIFAEFAAGKSPRAIAKALNAEGIAGSFGSSWGPSTITVTGAAAPAFSTTNYILGGGSGIGSGS